MNVPDRIWINEDFWYENPLRSTDPAYTREENIKDLTSETKYLELSARCTTAIEKLKAKNKEMRRALKEALVLIKSADELAKIISEPRVLTLIDSALKED